LTQDTEDMILIGKGYILTLFSVLHHLLRMYRDMAPTVQTWCSLSSTSTAMTTERPHDQQLLCERHGWMKGAVFMTLWVILHPHITGAVCPEMNPPTQPPGGISCADVSWSCAGEWFATSSKSTSPFLMQCIQNIAYLVDMSPSNKLLKGAVVEVLRNPLVELSSSTTLPSYSTTKGLCLVAHVLPQLFAPAFCEKLSQLMQRIVSQPSRWLTAHLFFIVTTILSTIGAVLFNNISLTVDFRPLQVFSLMLEPSIAAEAIMRQCAEPMFQESHSLVPLLGFVLSLHPNSTAELLVRYLSKKSFPLSAKDQPTQTKLSLLQQEIVKDIMRECHSALTVVHKELEVNCFQPLSLQQQRQHGLQAMLRASQKTEQDIKSIQLLWQSFSDVEIVATESSEKSQRFQCHRTSLCAKSQFFKASFLSGLEECRSNVIQLRDMDIWALQVVLQWIYSPCSFAVTSSDSSSSSQAVMSQECVIMFPLPSSNSGALSLALDDCVRVLHVADFLGVEELVGMLGSELCSGGLMTVSGIDKLTEKAMQFVDMGMPFATRMLRACHTFALQHAHQLMDSASLAGGLLALEHYSMGQAVVQQAPWTDNERVQTVRVLLMTAAEGPVTT